jgi:hypothetical protein
MSILQEYEEQSKCLGQGTVDTTSEYISFLKAEGINILYSDIIYKKEEWQKFANWRKKVYNRKHGKSSKGD